MGIREWDVAKALHKFQSFPRLQYITFKLMMWFTLGQCMKDLMTILQQIPV